LRDYNPPRTCILMRYTLEEVGSPLVLPPRFFISSAYHDSQMLPLWLQFSLPPPFFLRWDPRPKESSHFLLLELLFKGGFVPLASCTCLDDQSRFTEYPFLLVQVDTPTPFTPLEYWAQNGLVGSYSTFWSRFFCPSRWVGSDE